MHSARTWLVGVAVAAGVSAALCTAACGGDGGATAPTPPTTPPAGTTITISAAGASPTTLTVPPGSRVTFVNNDSRPHDMASDPHPEHTQCPALNIGFSQPGQTLQTQNLNTAGTCSFHDHNQPTNTSLQGTIRIQ
jgi:plastocyanin